LATGELHCERIRNALQMAAKGREGREVRLGVSSLEKERSIRGGEKKSEGTFT